MSERTSSVGKSMFRFFMCHNAFANKLLSRFQTNETSPLTNLVLSSLDLRPDVQRKEAIAAFLSGSDITSRYNSLHGDRHLMRVSIKSSLNTWSLLLPRNLTTKELWELSFRLTKGRMPGFELQHRNARLSPSQDTISATINTDHPVFITPSDTEATAHGKIILGDMCLVKVYDKSYDQAIASFWEPKNTTRSIGAAIFRYYRQKFMMKATTAVENPFVFWTKMHSSGDGKLVGTVLDGPWEPLSKFFNHTDSIGTLAQESFIEKNDDDDDNKVSIAAVSQRSFGRNAPFVFKVALSRPPSDDKKRDKNLSRLDVLKQMFDAFINRLLAYGYQTHIGLVTFASKATLLQEITNAVENFRHKLNQLAAKGDTAIWDSQ